MAERQSVIRWIRQAVPLLLSAGIAAAISTNVVQKDDTATCAIDFCATTADTLDAVAPETVQQRCKSALGR